MFVEVTGEKLVGGGGGFLAPYPSVWDQKYILLNNYLMLQKENFYLQFYKKCGLEISTRSRSFLLLNNPL